MACSSRFGRLSGSAVEGFGRIQHDWAGGNKGETESASGCMKMGPGGRTLQGEPEVGSRKVNVLRGAGTRQEPDKRDEERWPLSPGREAAKFNADCRYWAQRWRRELRLTRSTWKFQKAGVFIDPGCRERKHRRCAGNNGLEVRRRTIGGLKVDLSAFS